MSKIHKQRIIDPEAALAKFNEDLAKMRVGNKLEDPAAPKPRQLVPERFGKPESKRNTWIVTITDDTTWDELLGADYWKPAAFRITNGDRIEVRNDSLTLIGELLVVAANPQLAAIEVREIFRKELAPADQIKRDAHAIRAEYRGVTDQWCLIRKADGTTLKKGLASEDQAMMVAANEFQQKVTPWLG